MTVIDVKSAEHSQFTVAVSALLYPQMHELLIRCSLAMLLKHLKSNFYGCPAMALSTFQVDPLQMQFSLSQCNV
jgi:hypothetical protein